MKLYHYPKCSTCKKAIKYLRDQGIDADLIDISQQTPSTSELQAMLSSYQGDLRKLFNTSGMQYRELGMKDKLPGMSAEDAIELLTGNGMLIKRPFLLAGANANLVGFKQDEWEAAGL